MSIQQHQSTIEAGESLSLTAHVVNTQPISRFKRLRSFRSYYETQPSDFRYEWWVDGSLVDASGNTFTFTSHDPGQYDIVVRVIHNCARVDASTQVTVQSTVSNGFDVALTNFEWNLLPNDAYWDLVLGVNLVNSGSAIPPGDIHLSVINETRSGQVIFERTYARSTFIPNYDIPVMIPSNLGSDFESGLNTIKMQLSSEYISEETDISNNELSATVYARSDWSCEQERTIVSTPRNDAVFENYRLDISAQPDMLRYRIKWFSGGWSPWYIPGAEDIDWKTNTDGSKRRVWSYFGDHHHEYVECSGVQDDPGDNSQGPGIDHSQSFVTAVVGPIDPSIEMQLLTDDQEDKALARFRFSAHKEPAEVLSLAFEVESNPDLVPRLYLYDGERYLGSATVDPVSGLALFSFDQGSGFYLPGNDSKTLTVRGDIGSVVNRPSYRRSFFVRLLYDQHFTSINPKTGKILTAISGVASGTTNASAWAQTFYVHDSIPYVHTSSTERPNLLNNAENTVYTFDVTADPAGDIGFKQVKVMMHTNTQVGNGSLNNFRLLRGDSDITDQVSIMLSDGTNVENGGALVGEGRSDVFLVFDSEELVSAGESITYVLKAEVDGFTDQGDYVSSKIYGGRTNAYLYPYLDTHSSGFLTLSNGVEQWSGPLDALSFIWSDYAFVSHSQQPGFSSGDWANGYLVEYVPTASWSLLVSDPTEVVDRGVPDDSMDNGDSEQPPFQEEPNEDTSDNDEHNSDQEHEPTPPSSSIISRTDRMHDVRRTRR